MTIKSTLICATAIAIALTSFDLRPAAAAPEGGPAIVKQNAGADEFSAQRKRRGRGVHPAVPLAAFGAIVGTIGAVAAANARRDYYERHYYAPGYYGGPAYGYYGAARAISTTRRRCISVTTARPPTASRLLQPLRLGRPARLSRPERERAGSDELRQRGRPERAGAAAAVARRERGRQQLTWLDQMRSGGPRAAVFHWRPAWSGHILRQKFTC